MTRRAVHSGRRRSLVAVRQPAYDEALRSAVLSIVRELPDGWRIRTVAPAGRLPLTPAVAGDLVRPPVALQLPDGIEMVGRFRPAEISGGDDAKPRTA